MRLPEPATYATSVTVTLSASSGFTGAAFTATYTPNGNWGPGVTGAPFTTVGPDSREQHAGHGVLYPDQCRRRHRERDFSRGDGYRFS